MTQPRLCGVLAALTCLLSLTPTSKVIGERCWEAQPECIILGRFWYSQELSIASAFPSQDAGLSAEEFWGCNGVSVNLTCRESHQYFSYSLDNMKVRYESVSMECVNGTWVTTWPSNALDLGVLPGCSRVPLCMGEFYAKSSVNVFGKDIVIFGGPERTHLVNTSLPEKKYSVIMTVEGEKCRFPFSYNRLTYDSCSVFNGTSSCGKLFHADDTSLGECEDAKCDHLCGGAMTIGPDDLAGNNGTLRCVKNGFHLGDTKLLEGKKYEVSCTSVETTATTTTTTTTVSVTNSTTVVSTTASANTTAVPSTTVTPTATTSVPGENATLVTTSGTLLTTAAGGVVTSNTDSTTEATLSTNSTVDTTLAPNSTVDPTLASGNTTDFTLAPGNTTDTTSAPGNTTYTTSAPGNTTDTTLAPDNSTDTTLAPGNTTDFTLATDNTTDTIIAPDNSTNGEYILSSSLIFFSI
ncbi:hypothetical protein C7M84_019511 [Penaeus vannamei]|uniref:Uncharacterized protein n=1 Tax=Penaeus vannamei TaxID=6689 RepID=A0A3R7LYT7_PENVA|nr:hypothetical protein C7M84_019511 [Penaeus vannamei]